MKKTEIKRINTDRDYFLEAIEFTRRSTGFLPALIEKDYMCTLVLSHFYSVAGCPLIFKGGTALNKVHLGFYRLSEDLDFSISVPVKSTRSQRSKTMTPIKHLFLKLPKALPELEISGELTGRNDSLQYIGELRYPSVLTEQSGAIQVEIGLREPNLLPTKTLSAKTLLIDPLSREPAFPGVQVTAFSIKEAYAEKLRAALSRREPAIRDYFDIFHAVKNSLINLGDPEVLRLTQEKLSVPGNHPIGLTAERIAALKEQLEAELRPVLQKKALDDFRFDEAIRSLEAFQGAISRIS